MIAFPNAKINLGLYITEKRKDGYHNVATLFYPTSLKDSLEILPQSVTHQSSDELPKAVSEKIQRPLDGLAQAPPAYVEGTAKRVRFSHSGIPVSGAAADNLCIKAYQLLLGDFPDLPAIQMHLHKNIPLGAGMGGGSADATFTLQLLNELFSLELNHHQLNAYARQLGSDCAFFLLNKPALATGRGEILTPITLDLTGYHLVIVHPGIHVPTATAFSHIQPKYLGEDELMQLVSSPVPSWKDHLQNQFESTIFNAYPAIQQLKEKLYHFGAVYASMTGSGSTVYALFSEKADLSKWKLPASYLKFQFKL